MASFETARIVVIGLQLGLSLFPMCGAISGGANTTRRDTFRLHSQDNLAAGNSLHANSCNIYTLYKLGSLEQRPVDSVQPCIQTGWCFCVLPAPKLSRLYVALAEGVAGSRGGI